MSEILLNEKHDDQPGQKESTYEKLTVIKLYTLIYIALNAIISV